ncbi:tetratricopeptide repeat protein [Sulfitobacter pseudonitzschiae]|uniref:Tetratricopeptide repeat protein n=1 Tax=Pseudosulfitobacter pseudonitzschiae TaxID=1402135 RepID=A0A9Q2NMG3_9RHOB|nr:tetratricopeptide repeat protein [Pseudosulfitobacter pseudonitzschiae]MBM2291489.1 tetratricopeptide repeat protein [Pseudosulfitobacter pseudonitzschiae]MBM2296407.1 tetratricopeptide repeat protein [Pseudosulfitobacter pseudonitzschiae]MBM2301320.1 tetratricopeptide repeat protein [Pseudosulfitobacter pseudonitzschiae]MBM2311104.1 tetratricopeptide repeat protein [Pseudosulfitobacter pseudonitzschiae]MBM2316017.1 tetratricopeptide repeat protein [Pseudosulfitobacter pseudonitzschiae]
MRHPILFSACIAGAMVLSACEKKSGDAAVKRAFQDVNVVDESNLNDVMLTVADPNEAVAYFQRTSANDPSRIDLQRGLASSLVRAKRTTEAATAYGKVVKMDGATADDQVDYADALIRSGDWAQAEKVLDGVPPTHETFKRYRLEAMVADSNQEWKKADSFYEIAVGLTTQPAGVMNNWGYSKLTRGDYTGAERLFGEAIRQDQTLFTAKNNMILARGAQRDYTLPVIPMDQVERAQLLHTLALSAIKQGDVETGKGLLRDAIETHPQHFEAAVRSLQALENNVSNG